MCKLLSARISSPFIVGGAFYLHLKRSLSNSIPQGIKSIRRVWQCGPQKNSRGFRTITSSKAGVAPSYYTVIPSHFPYPPTPLFEPFCQKKKERGWGVGCHFGGENS
ncbi:hypothetical protein CEXT_181891 [Caerostris extrusa]|uniref:Uncharacterized protein n=1 Tax=Caerostris extrusa TaxID=172846 RepID=A0AAV4QM05_CAEEX|nr:hypothetical protein CEXT_181891 [Caerostris extrusa]